MGKKCRQRKRQLKQKKGGKKGKGKGKKRNRNNNNRQTSALPSCFSKMFKYASKYKKAGNIFRQVKRTEGNKDKIEKKGKKKGDSLLLVIYKDAEDCTDCNCCLAL